MRLKLDENLGRRVGQVFSDAGHHVSTVREQGLSGKPDEQVFAACRGEGLALITLDQDFGNILRFPAEGTQGVMVIENPVPASHDLLLELARFAARELNKRSIQGKLWIVQPTRIRQRPA